MKNWLVRISKPLLTTAMAFGFWIGVGITSAILFGEYAYPIEK